MSQASTGRSPYLTTAEAAAYLNYCEFHFRVLVRTGKVPSPVRVSGKLLWRKALLDEHMRALEAGQIPSSAA